MTLSLEGLEDIPRPILFKTAHFLHNLILSKPDFFLCHKTKQKTKKRPQWLLAYSPLGCRRLIRSRGCSRGK
jgi:hypothetical protein